MTSNNIPIRQIRATHNEAHVRVYQAYNNAIADAALREGTFVSPPFKIDRMTWIKPSFLWMMYRSGWAEKYPDQARILAIDVSRDGFEWALAHSCLSHPPEGISDVEWKKLKQSSSVRIQWDPERNLKLDKLEHRSIQIGLSGVAVSHYISNWIHTVTDVTGLAKHIASLVRENKLDAAEKLLPVERAYDLPTAIAQRLGIRKC